MSFQDPISDMFVRIKNAQAVKKQQVIMPCSKLKTNIAKVLLSEGYIHALEVVDNNRQLVITLKYYRRKPVIELLQRVSLPGRRVYRSVKDLPRVMGGIGTVIVSTSKQGVVSGRTARANNLGGEVLGLIA